MKTRKDIAGKEKERGKRNKNVSLKEILSNLRNNLNI
jgi:hypothetical protein